MIKKIILKEEKIYRGNLILVNEQYPLKNIITNGLTAFDIRYPQIYILRDAANVLQLLLEKISSNNSIVPVSGYRSLEEQTKIFECSLIKNGESFTRKFVALPNHSEHQTGLAIDLGLMKTPGDNIDFICPYFPYTGLSDKFRKIAPDYGFIERYLKEKEAITGISHEPWHFRYVGFPHSKIIQDNRLSLEEYIEFLKEFRADSKFLYKCDCNIEIYYVPAKNNETTIELPEKSLYQISGNNVDGFIVTVWRKNNEQ